MVQVVEHLLSKLGALSSNPNIAHQPTPPKKIQAPKYHFSPVLFMFEILLMFK
jgi:hypothetical protein